MKVNDVMTKKVSICRPDNNLAEVAATMWNARCGALPVLDSTGNVLSMITDRDICIALGTRNARPSDVKVSDVSLPRIFTCRFDDDVSLALQTMVAQNVRRLPVIGDNGSLVGILSIDDVLLRSEKTPAKSGISYADVVNAAKSILENRASSHVKEAAALIATHA